MAEGISKFLESKGGLDILLGLREKERSFNELEELLGLSPNTVLMRLREAQRLGLIEEKLFRDNGRSKIKYILTEKGGDVLDASRSIKKNYLELRKEVGKLEEKRRKKEMRIKELLSSLQKSTATVSISRSKITSKGNQTIKAEVRNENRVKKRSKE